MITSCAMVEPMRVRLPAPVFDPLRVEAEAVRRVYTEASLPSVVPVDVRFFRRLARAVDDGLSMIDRCGIDEYHGPRREEVIAGSLGLEWLGVDILRDALREDPTELSLAWFIVAMSALLCENDACEAEFAPIVLARPTEVKWFVASSILTWRHSGMYTPPILRESLERMIRRSPSLARTLDAPADEYEEFMFGHANSVLLGEFAPPSRTEWQSFVDRYEAAVACGESARGRETHTRRGSS